MNELLSPSLNYLYEVNFFTRMWQAPVHCPVRLYTTTYLQYLHPWADRVPMKSRNKTANYASMRRITRTIVCIVCAYTTSSSNTREGRRDPTGMTGFINSIHGKKSLPLSPVISWFNEPVVSVWLGQQLSTCMTTISVYSIHPRKTRDAGMETALQSLQLF